MIAVLQRVNSAVVYADGELSGKIEKGLYILLGVEKEDSMYDIDLLSEKIAKLRIFSDENGKMNLSVNDIGGSVMIVPNFTLNANYSHGNRPDFFNGAPPHTAEMMFLNFVDAMRNLVKITETGKFGADMRTEMSTDGPVTIVMDSKILHKKK